MYRRHIALHNLLEVDGVLDSLLMVLSGIDMGFVHWEGMVDTWRQIRLGELSPVKQYLTGVNQNPTRAHMARTITAKMILAILQVMQLNVLCNRRLALCGPEDGQMPLEDHPFLHDLRDGRRLKGVLLQIRADLGQVGNSPNISRSSPFLIFDVTDLCLDALSITQAPRPPNAELFGVVLLCWSCFMHLTQSEAQNLSPTLQNEWKSADRLYIDMVHHFAAFHSLADIVYDLLTPTATASTTSFRASSMEGPAVSTPMDVGAPSAGLLNELWSRVGYQDILNNRARHLGHTSSFSPVHMICKNTLVDTLEGILAAAYVGTRASQEPLIPRRHHTLPRTRFLAFVAAAAMEGNGDYSTILLERYGAFRRRGGSISQLKDENESPLLFLLEDSYNRDPLLFFHLLGSLASESKYTMESTRSKEALKVLWSHYGLGRYVRSTLPEKAKYSIKDGERDGRMFELTSSSFVHNLGIVLPKGTKGSEVTYRGQYPVVVEWEFTVGTLVLVQLESFVNRIHELRLRAILRELERTRQQLRCGSSNEPKNIGLASLFDRYPALFAYGPSTTDTSSSTFVDFLVKYGAWPVLHYSLRRVEMVLDQLALMVTRNGSLLQFIDRVEPSGRSTFKLTHRLPHLLIRLVRSVAETLDNATPQEEVYALTSLEVSALNLLRVLIKKLPQNISGEYIARVLFDEVEEGSSQGSEMMGTSQVPFLVWLASQSIQHERVTGQHKIISQAVSLIRHVVAWACRRLDILHFPGRPALMIQMVDLAVTILAMMETWSFAMAGDRWALSRRCLLILEDYLQAPFADDDPSTTSLEESRLALFDRFRTDNALMRALLRCVGSQTLPALSQLMEQRARHEASRHGSLRGQGLFELRPVLPLSYDDNVEDDLRVPDKALSLLILVLQHFAPRLYVFPLSPDPGYTDAVTASAIGALSLLTKDVDISASRSSRASRTSPVCFAVVLASLMNHPSSSIKLQAVEAFTLLIGFNERLRKAREVEAAQIPSQASDSTKSPFLDLIPIHEAHRLRAMLFKLLVEEWSQDAVLCSAILNLFVEVIRQQPSLASVLIFVDQKIAVETFPQAKTLGELVAALVSQADDELLERPSFYRFLWAVLKGAILRVKWLQSFISSIPQPDTFWVNLLMPLKVQEDRAGLISQSIDVGGMAVDRDEAYNNSVRSYCLRAASCRYLLDSLALLWHQAASANDPSMKMTVDDLLRHIRKTDAQLCRIWKIFTEISSFRTSRMYDMERQLASALAMCQLPATRSMNSRSSDKGIRLELTFGDAPKEGFNLAQFRRPEWAMLMKDCDPRKLDDYLNFIYDVPAVRRFLTSHGVLVGSEERVRVEQLLGNVNEYYAKTSVQMSLLNAWKNLVQVREKHCYPHLKTLGLIETMVLLCCSCRHRLGGCLHRRAGNR